MDILEIKHNKCTLTIDDPDKDGEFCMEVENGWGERSTMYLNKDEAKQLVEFLQKHII